MYPAIAIPRWLYGNTREVKKAWYKLRTTIWDIGYWPNDIVTNEYNIDNKSAFLVVSKYGEGHAIQQHYWLCTIPECSFNTPDLMSSQWHKHATLTWNGMAHFWFALAISSNSFGGCEFFNAIDRGNVFVYNDAEYFGKTFYRRWFEFYLRWFKEFEYLQDSIYNHFSVSRSDAYFNKHDAYSTIWHVAYRADICDYRTYITPGNTKKQFSDLVEMLVSSKIVKHDQGVYSLL